MPDELDLLKGLGRELAEPDDESIHRARDLLEQRIGSPPRAGSPFRLRWGVVVVVAALGTGSGLGFGVGTFLTPSGRAGGHLEGFGFVTARGWNVTQTGSLAESGAVRAVAATIPLAAGDEARALPYATLQRLEPGGAVVVARLSPRGDESTDRGFPLRSLPLRLVDAAPAGLPRALSRTSLVSLRIRAGTGGYNVDARVLFGGPPSPAMLGRVDEQLRRLVVAPADITLVVLPRIIRSLSQELSIFGSVSGTRAGEKVTIQFKACGLYPVLFRDTYETTTNPGGGFTVDLPPPRTPGVSGVFRAVHRDSVSAEVPVRHQAPVTLLIRRGGRFEAAVTGRVGFWRRYVVLQRYEGARGRWVNVRRLVLTEQWDSGSTGSVTVLTAPFRPRVPRGTRIRVVFPLSQARPCYLAGVSDVRRT